MDELQAVKKSTSKNSRYNFCEVDFLHPGVLVLNKNGKQKIFMKIYFAKNGSPCVIQEIIIKSEYKGNHYGSPVSVPYAKGKTL